MNQRKTGIRNIILTALFCVGLASRADETNKVSTLGDDNERLYHEAIPQGKEQAQQDLTNNIVRFYVVAFPGPIFQREKQILKDRYSVDLVSVGDVRPPPPRDGFLTGYNQIVSAFLQKTYGKDILAETEAQVEAEAEANK